MRRAITVLAAAALFLAVPVSGQDAEVTGWGDDALDDDSETVNPVALPFVGGGVSRPAASETTDIDDIVRGSVRADGSDLVFKVVVAEEPGEADAIVGNYCWMVAFQVGVGSDEFVALRCIDYGAPDATFEARTTSRGTNVATSAEWLTDEKAVALTVPLADISAAPGDVLTDIYLLTYTGDGLYVTDTYPDAKSDRDAAENLGCYVIGATAEQDWSNCEGIPEPEVQETIEATVDAAAPTWGYTFNGTEEGARLSLTGFSEAVAVEIAAPDVQGNATVSLRHAEFDDPETADSADLEDGLQLQAEASTAGTWIVEIISDGLIGEVTVTASDQGERGDGQGGDGGDGGDGSSGGSDGGDGDQDGSDGEDGAGNATTGDGDKDSPGAGLILVIASVAVAAARRR